MAKRVANVQTALSISANLKLPVFVSKNYLKQKIISCNRAICTGNRLFYNETPSDEMRNEGDFNLEQVKTPAHYTFGGVYKPFRSKIDFEKTGPEPFYEKISSGYKKFLFNKPFYLKYNNCILPQIEIAYETWGTLNEKKDNLVLICPGLSASSHAKSHDENPQPGWWEKFIGPGRAIDTDHFFVVCTNMLGGCYGSTGPSSINPIDGKPYATTFPILSVEDMVKAQFMLLDDLQVQRAFAIVGASLGGMMSLLSAAHYRNRIGRTIVISSAAQAYPGSIAMRYLQRRAIMSDPHWNKGHYYDGEYPRQGMKLAREIATLSYRSGPEWDKRFGRGRVDDSSPSLCPTFNIENYLEYQGEEFCNKFDPNSLLYISKAMDLFDISEGYASVEAGLARIKCPVMIIGVQTDILFPIWQQRVLHRGLMDTGNSSVIYYELNSEFGHDTFLLDLNGTGAAIKGFLQTDLKEYGTASNKKNRPQEHSTIRHLFDPVRHR